MCAVSRLLCCSRSGSRLFDILDSVLACLPVVEGVLDHFVVPDWVLDDLKPSFTCWF